MTRGKHFLPLRFIIFSVFDDDYCFVVFFFKKIKLFDVPKNGKKLLHDSKEAEEKWKIFKRDLLLFMNRSHPLGLVSRARLARRPGKRSRAWFALNTAQFFYRREKNERANATQASPLTIETIFFPGYQQLLEQPFVVIRNLSIVDDRRISIVPTRQSIHC